MVWFSFVKTYRHPQLSRFSCVEAAVPALVFLGSVCLSCSSLPGEPVAFSVMLLRCGDTSERLSALLSGSSASCCTLGREIAQAAGKCVCCGQAGLGTAVSLSVCLSAEEVTVTQPRSRACWALCPSPVHPAEQPQPGLVLPWALQLGQAGLCELARASFGL